jgi:hypothetical protein
MIDGDLHGLRVGTADGVAMSDDDGFERGVGGNEIGEEFAQALRSCVGREKVGEL